MAANLEDPASWRLRTSGGIPYKIVSLTGSLEEVGGEVTFDILIPTAELITFCIEMFPPPIQINGLWIPRFSTFGSTNLRIQKIMFKAHEETIPIDPFHIDPLALAKTYGHTLRLTIQYGPPRYHQDPDPNDPTTFLEVRASVTGEFLHTTPQSITWQVLKSDGTPDGKPDKNRVEQVPASILSPQTMWNVKWNKIPYSFFRDTIRPRLELLLGKVNSAQFSLLYANDPKTLLFVGYDYDYSFTWNSNLQDTPLINLDMKFLEKRIVWKSVLLWSDGSPRRVDDSTGTDQNNLGTTYTITATINGVLTYLYTPGTGALVYGPYLVRGHCDFWRPGVGWSRMLINGREAYDSIDFNSLFA